MSAEGSAQRSLFGDDVHRSAVISACETYRYELRRVWDASLPLVGFCGVNPSKADGRVDDHTARKWTGFATRWGFGGFVAVNEFAYRATLQSKLRHAYATGVDVVGPDNDDWLERVATETTSFIVCWGNGGALGRRHNEVLNLLRRCRVEPKCLGLTGNSQPKHPLTLAYTTRLQPYPKSA